MPHAKAIFFDLGETLVTQNIEDNMVTQQALQEIGRILPHPYRGKELYRIYQHGYRVNHMLRSSHYVEIPVQTWMSQLLWRALRGEPEAQLVNKAIDIIVASRAANAVAFEDAQSTLEKLSEHGVRLGLISNVSSHEVAEQILKNVGLRKYFDEVITSAHVGIRKPDPGIFLYALMQFHLKPPETAHVGDSEEHDIRGARAAGIRTVLVSRQRRTHQTVADYHFGTLKEATRLLLSL